MREDILDVFFAHVEEYQVRPYRKIQFSVDTHCSNQNYKKSLFSSLQYNTYLCFKIVIILRFWTPFAEKGWKYPDMSLILNL